MKTDIWRIRTGDLPRRKGFFIKQLRVFLLVIRGFSEDRCHLRASALTFYAVLSTVPVAAMAFAIAKGFGFQKLLEKQLLEILPGQEEVVARTVGFAHSLLENTKGGLLAGIGVAVLFWSVIKVLGQIEYSFNDIWGVKEQRTFGRKFSDYLSTMLVCPILIIMASSVTVFITTQITLITEKVALLGMFSPIIFFFLKLFPYCLIWIVLTFIYISMPNTKVRFTSGLVAGIVAGTIFVVVQWGYIRFQIGTAKYNAIYGSFAALPLFLIWLRISWLIILFGAEISFAHQNVDTYEFEPDSSEISSAFKRLLSLQISHLLIKGFACGAKPPTAKQISQTLEIPIRLVQAILSELVACGILSDIRTGEYKELAYQPARDINALTIHYVIEALDQRGVETVPVAQTEQLKVLSETLEAFRDAIEKSPKNKLLREI